VSLIRIWVVTRPSRLISKACLPWALPALRQFHPIKRFSRTFSAIIGKADPWSLYVRRRTFESISNAVFWSGSISCSNAIPCETHADGERTSLHVARVRTTTSSVLIRLVGGLAGNDAFDFRHEAHRVDI
jgi:hypothetical protein